MESGKGQWAVGRAGIADLLCCVVLGRLLHSLSLSFSIRSGEQLPLFSPFEDPVHEWASSGQSQGTRSHGAGTSDPSLQASCPQGPLADEWRQGRLLGGSWAMLATDPDPEGVG